MDESNNNRPWTLRHVRQDLNKELLSHFRGERSGYVQIGVKKYFLPRKFGEDGESYCTFKPRSSDTWVVSFPRSGTTWTQEMVWMLGNDLDYSGSAKVPLVERFPFFEFGSCVHDDVLNEFLTAAKDDEVRDKVLKACSPVLDQLENTKQPRFIKSHLPFSLLPADLLSCGAKVVYVARNPKDVAVSYFHFHKFIKTLDFVGDFETFWDYFERNLLMWTPYWDHLKEAWDLRHNPNLLFLFYEDLKKDLKGNLLKIQKFLNKNYNPEEIDKLITHLDFGNFQKNPSVNMEVLRELGMLSDYNQKCIRQGTTGGWKQLFTPDLEQRANRWIQQNLDKTGLKFPDY